MKTVRGNKVSIIFQDPMTSLNPTYTIGTQLMEAILLHTDRDKKQAKERAIEMKTYAFGMMQKSNDVLKSKVRK